MYMLFDMLLREYSKQCMQVLLRESSVLRKKVHSRWDQDDLLKTAGREKMKGSLK
jgi:hypothetical protein